MSEKQSGPFTWGQHVDDENPHWWIADNETDADVTLRIDGNFDSDADAKRYCLAMCKMLNDARRAAPEVARQIPREPVRQMIEAAGNVTPCERWVDTIKAYWIAMYDAAPIDDQVAK